MSGMIDVSVLLQYILQICGQSQNVVNKPGKSKHNWPLNSKTPDVVSFFNALVESEQLGYTWKVDHCMWNVDWFGWKIYRLAEMWTSLGG